MKITKVVFTKIEDIEDKKLIGSADIILENCFAINDIKLYDGQKGKYLIFPRRKNIDTAYPINNDFRKELLEAIIESASDDNE